MNRSSVAEKRWAAFNALRHQPTDSLSHVLSAQVPQPRCEHVALIYDGVEDLARRLAPSLRRAAAEGGAVLVCLDEPATARVRNDLGAVTDSFVFMPAATRYANPGVAMAALDRFVVDALSSGARSAWSVGSIPLDGDNANSRWMRYEAAVTNVFAERPLRAVCLYDASTTPLALRRSIGHAHGTVDGAWKNDGHGESTPATSDLCPTRAPDLILTDAQPGAARASIDDLFADHVSDEALAALRLVATELTTNAMVHGTPPVHVRIWKEGDACVIEVHDAGIGPIDEYADLRPCAGGAHGGFGLWLVGQLADAVHIAAGERGTAVAALLRNR